MKTLLAVALAATVSTGAFAQAFPAKPITFVVPFAAGGPTDLVARQLAETMRKYVPNSTFVVENATGAFDRMMLREGAPGTGGVDRGLDGRVAALDKLAQKYQMLGVQVWGVNVENDSSAAKAYLSKVQVAFPILFDVDNSVSKDYRVEAMPTTVILDKDGKVRSVHRGYKPGYEKKYEDDIKGLLRE